MNQNHHLLELSEVISGEQMILHMQDVLLTPAVHELAVVSVVTGRSLLLTFLHSLPVYHSIGYLSLTMPAPENTIDIMQDLFLLACNEEDALSVELLEEYLIHHLFADIIIIEATRELAVKPWFILFKDLLSELHFSSPVIILNQGS